jgi:hypothetical protein
VVPHSPQDSVKPPETNPGKWKTAVSYLKDFKEVLAATTAIVAAVAFALSYFATSRALNCFKAEARKSNELVQTILQVNTLTASWESTNLAIRQLDARRQSPGIQPGSTEHDGILKDIVKAQAQTEAITAELRAARDRKIALERTSEPCE